MTIQAYEKLFYNGEEYCLDTYPLEVFFNNNDKPFVAVICSACWREYIGTWEIKDSKLFFMEAQSNDGDNKYKDRVFPDEKGPVFAKWFSGALVCPCGDRVAMPSIGRGVYCHEEYLVLEVENGVVDEVKQLNQNQYNEYRRENFSWFMRYRDAKRPATFKRHNKDKNDKNNKLPK